MPSPGSEPLFYHLPGGGPMTSVPPTVKWVSNYPHGVVSGLNGERVQGLVGPRPRAAALGPPPCYPVVLASPAGLSPYAHPRHSTGPSVTFLASKSGCTRTSAPATDTQSSTRTRPSRTHLMAVAALQPPAPESEPQEAGLYNPAHQRAQPRSSRAAEGTWLWKLSPLCPLSRTITQGPPPAPGVISERAPERRALTAHLPQSTPASRSPRTKQRPHLGFRPPPDWLGPGAQGAGVL